jgi:hypothetical protein
MDLTALVSGAGEIQDPLGDGGLAGIDMGENAEIAHAGQRAVLLTVVKVGTHGPMAFRVMRIGTARFADEAACNQAMRRTPCGGSERSRLRDRPGQFVTDRCRPRSRNLTHEDTRITSYRDRGALTAML